jgi:hypothetical protein
MAETIDNRTYMQNRRMNLKMADLDTKVNTPPIVPVTGNKVLALTDVANVQKITAATVITVPPNSAVAFPIGAEIAIVAYTTGEVSIAPGAGVTLLSASNNRKINGQYTGVTLKKMATDEWLLLGSLKA